jgi:hypothetical protein
MEFKRGDYIIFKNSREEWFGIVLGPPLTRGAYPGWVRCEFFPSNFAFGILQPLQLAVDPNFLKPVSDTEVCILRMEGKI